MLKAGSGQAVYKRGWFVKRWSVLTASSLRGALGRGVVCSHPTGEDTSDKYCIPHFLYPPYEDRYIGLLLSCGLFSPDSCLSLKGDIYRNNRAFSNPSQIADDKKNKRCFILMAFVLNFSVFQQGWFCPSWSWRALPSPSQDFLQWLTRWVPVTGCLKKTGLPKTWSEVWTL